MPFDAIHELLPTPRHVQPEWVGWLSLSSWTRTAFKPPAFILGDCPSQLSSYFYDHIGEADTGVYRLRETGVTGSGMIVHDLKLVACNHIGHSASYCRGQVLSGRIGEPGRYTRRHIDQAVLLLGAGYDVYGHWLVDIVPKLFALQSIGLELSGLSYLVPSDTPDFGFKWLRLAGIQDDQIIKYDPLNEIVVAQELLVPLLLRSGSRASSLFAGAVDFILHTIEAANPEWTAGLHRPDAIFISRAHANREGRSLLNRETIEAIAVDQGYVLVYPEHLPIIEQVALFRDATRIVGEYGSGLHGSIFSASKTRVCSLRGAARHPGFLQSGLAQALNQECGYVLGNAPIDAIQFQFTIEPAHFRQSLLLMSLPAA